MQLTCNGSNLNYSRHSTTPSPPLPQCSSLRVRGEGQSVRNVNWFYLFFSGPISEPFLPELPNCSPLCSLFSSVTDFTWFLVEAFGVSGSCAHCKWQSPLLSPIGAEEAKRITQRSSEASESSKPIWALPQVTHCCQDTSPPNSAQENQATALPARIRATSCAHMLTWHIWCQGLKLLIRM